VSGQKPWESRRPSLAAGRVLAPADSGERVPSENANLPGPLASLDFSRVRIHHDREADELATEVSAIAFSAGQHIFFRQGAYAPHQPDGQRLLRHELVHALQGQQATAGGADVLTVSDPCDAAEREADAIACGRVAHRPAVSAFPPALRRVLAAYSREHSETLPSGESFSVTEVRSSPEASHLRSALAALIAAGKVVVDSVGDRDFFSLPTTGSATVAEIEAALAAGGLPRPAELARALADAHNAHLFTGAEVTLLHSLITIEVSHESDALRQTDRPLTADEASQAHLVFGGGLDYGAVRITEDPLLGAGNIARTLPGSINFPPGSSLAPGYLPWLIHELTHIWQYQHGVSLAHTATTAFLCWAGVQTYDYGGEPGLLATTAAGKGLSSFNTEQQGDIARDYYMRTVRGQNTTAWTPFVAEIRIPP
jgi:hypothetical protein